MCWAVLREKKRVDKINHPLCMDQGCGHGWLLGGRTVRLEPGGAGGAMRCGVRLTRPASLTA